MDEEIFLKECEEKVSIEADYILRNLERFAEEEMKNKHQEEYDTFAKDKIFYIFTSSKEEFEKNMD